MGAVLGGFFLGEFLGDSFGELQEVPWPRRDSPVRTTPLGVPEAWLQMNLVRCVTRIARNMWLVKQKEGSLAKGSGRVVIVAEPITVNGQTNCPPEMWCAVE